MYQCFAINTRRQAERFDYFQSLITEALCPMQIDVDRTVRPLFAASVQSIGLNNLRLMQVSTSPLTVKRRWQDIANVDDPPYLVKFQVKGECFWTQRGKDVHTRAGDFVIASTAEPYSLTFKGYYEMPVLVVPRAVMFRLTHDPDRFLGVRMSGDDADCGLLTSFVAQVVACMSKLSDQMIQRVEVSMLDLLGGVLSARDRHRTLPRTHQLTQIKMYIDNHLRDRDLTPALIAKSFALSTRSIHAIFEEEGMSIGKYIRHQRVAACRREIDQGSTTQATLADLAMEWGFYDLSHMTRCFREVYGLPPGNFAAHRRDVVA